MQFYATASVFASHRSQSAKRIRGAHTCTIPSTRFPFIIVAFPVSVSAARVCVRMLRFADLNLINMPSGLQNDVSVRRKIRRRRRRYDWNCVQICEFGRMTVFSV